MPPPPISFPYLRPPLTIFKAILVVALPRVTPNTITHDNEPEGTRLEFQIHYAEQNSRTSQVMQTKRTYKFGSLPLQECKYGGKIYCAYSSSACTRTIVPFQRNLKPVAVSIAHSALPGRGSAKRSRPFLLFRPHDPYFGTCHRVARSGVG